MIRQQPRIVVVTRETRLDTLLRRWTTRGQVQFMRRMARAAVAVQAGDLERADQLSSEEDLEFEDLQREDLTYEEAISELSRSLDFGMPVQVIDRQYLPTFDFGLTQVVVVVGQDGLVANTAKYVGDVPIVGVNPEPSRFDGILLPFHVNKARAAVSRVLSGQARIREVTLAQATLHDGQKLLAFNDFFVGAGSHVSARYEIRAGGRSEPQSSSGVLVSTGAGSTGWMSSVFNMARGITQWLGVESDPMAEMRMDWSDPWLLWAVREPFISRTSGASLVAGRIAKGDVLEIESLMSSGGVIFSDGIEADFLEFNGGSIARIGVADQRARLVVPG